MTYDDIYTEERMNQEKLELQQWHKKNDGRIQTILRFANLVMEQKKQNMAEKLVLLMRQEEKSDIFENSAELVYVYLSAICYQDERANGYMPTIYHICRNVDEIILLFCQLRFFFWENIYQIHQNEEEVREYILVNRISNSVVYQVMLSAFEKEEEGLSFLIKLLEGTDRQEYFIRKKQGLQEKGQIYE